MRRSTQIMLVTLALLTAAPQRAVADKTRPTASWRGKLYQRARRHVIAARRALGAALITNGISAAAWLGRQLPMTNPARHGVTLTRDIRYRPGSDSPRHQLDVYKPKHGKGRPLPVVLYFPGGGFTSLSKNTHRTIALEFAKRGYIVAVASYRLAPKARFPAAHEDAADAYTWVVKNAKKLGADPKRLIVAGESAGANLATALAISASTRRPEPWAKRVFATGVAPKAVLPACGFLELKNPQRLAKGLNLLVADRVVTVADSYLGAGEARERATRRAGGTQLANPLTFLERLSRGKRKTERKLPAFFTGVGGADPLLDDSRRLHAAASRLGLRSELKIYPGEGHAFEAIPWKKQTKAFWRDTFRFLDKALAN